jgi:hypothetical protein
VTPLHDVEDGAPGKVGHQHPQVLGGRCVRRGEQGDMEWQQGAHRSADERAVAGHEVGVVQQAHGMGLLPDLLLQRARGQQAAGGTLQPQGQRGEGRSAAVP